MRISTTLLTILAAGATAGCAIKPDTSHQCHFVRRDLSVADPQVVQGAGLTEPVAVQKESLAGAMLDALKMHAEQRVVPKRDAMLFLSGGSLNGAFGAGFLDQWRSERQRLPDFSVVTGISTGAILSTFAFTGDTQSMVDGYTIDHEREILSPYTKMGPGGIGVGAAVTLLRKGAIGDLRPLRRRLDSELTDRIMIDVKRGADTGRKLYVGAVDVDRGEAVAFDMTDMASRWFAASGSERARFKDCYVEAIIASSSAPIAAPPVIIDDRMYIDGGARFGMFSDELGKVLDERVRDSGLAEPPPRTYVIVNGDQLIDDKSPPPGEHPPYTFLNLALRSEKILANQVYRFSADKIAARARTQARDFFFAKIDPDAGRFIADLDGMGGAPGRTCQEWHDADQQQDQPLQFYPRYMRCLISYGRHTADLVLVKWDPPIPQE